MKTETKIADSTFLRARRSLLLDHPFFGGLVMHLEEVPDASAKKGLWVDGVSVGYNPEQFDALDLAESSGLLAKGTLHCALGHHVRRGGRDKELWQEACDLVTNPLIFDSGLLLPKGATTNRQYVENSAEEVYVILERERQKQQQSGGGGKGQGKQGQQPGQNAPGSAQGQGQQQGQGQGQQNAPKATETGPQGPATGEVRDLPGEEGQAPSPAEQSKQAQEWKINMQQALQNAMARGDLPGSLQRLVQKELEPKTNWREEMRRFMQSLSKDDLTWSRPNRRFIGSDIYLPSVHGVRMGKMVVVNDTSGSTAFYQDAFFAEMEAIIEDVNPESILYVQQDAAIHKTTELEPGDHFERKTHGHGGTDFRPVFKWLDQEGIVPVCMVFLTDLDGPFPTDEPEYPVLWASAGAQPNRAVPFGEIVHIDLSQRE